MAQATWVLLIAVATAASSIGCRAGGRTPFQREEPDGGGLIIDAGSPEPPLDAPATPPHALLAIDPPHGPFSGGTLVALRGNGFTSAVRVWFGDEEVPEADVVAVSPQRIQVTVPAGQAGPVDVTTQNGDDASTRVTFSNGYNYDAFYAEPASGPTSGGTLITLHGQGTAWDEETRVTVDREPCEVTEVRSATELICRTPPGVAGARPVSVTTGDGVSVDVLDAFAYGNSDNGYRGGLSGNTLRNEIKVLAFDSFLGEALPDATVIVGTDQPLVARTDVNGVALVTADDLGPKATVTVAKRCFQPITFVDVPTDSLTVYLDPVLASTCFDPEGDIPGGGGTFGQGAGVTGELVWPQIQEFRRAGWTNVPDPKSADEYDVAYVFPLTSQPGERFDLPSAVAAITPDSGGEQGFQFNISTRPGNFTLYALAGLENRARSPYVFTPYAMGLIRGVAVPAGKTTDNVFIRIDIPLDHSLRLQVQGPKPTRRGPDRVQANVSVRLGREGYILLPGTRSETLLGGQPSDLEIVGLPPLVRALSGASYVASARAVTGNSAGLPLSVVGFVSTTTPSAPVPLGPFVELPLLTEPELNAVWNGRDLAWTSAPGGQAPDLVVVDIEGNGGLYVWRVVSPARNKRLQLPDLAAVDPRIAWPRGPQTFSLAAAHIANFDYGSLGYASLTERGWTAYAADSSSASY